MFVRAEKTERQKTVKNGDTCHKIENNSIMASILVAAICTERLISVVFTWYLFSLRERSHSYALKYGRTVDN